MRHYLTRIAVTAHALRRYRRRSGEHKASKIFVANLVRKRILPQLAMGLEPDRGGAVHVRLYDDLIAVALPSFTGGWIIKTIYGGPYWEVVRMSLRRFERLLELVEDYLDEHPEVAQEIAEAKDVVAQVALVEEVLRAMKPAVKETTRVEAMKREGGML